MTLNRMNILRCILNTLASVIGILYNKYYSWTIYYTTIIAHTLN